MPDLLNTSLPTVAPRAVAGTSFRAPPKVPMAVLRGVEMTISVPLPLPKLMLFLSFLLPIPRVSYQRLCNKTGPKRLPTNGSGISAPRLPRRPLDVRPVEVERGVEELGVGI